MRLFPLLSLLLVIILTFQNCQNATPKKPSVETTEIANIEKVNLSIAIDQTKLFSKAGLKGKELIRLPLGQELVYLNELSSFTTAISLNGIPFNEPWLKVETSDAQIGWIYAGAVKFDATGKGKILYDAIIRKRLANFFGQNAGKLIESYNQKYNNIETAYEFAQLYQLGQSLRDTLIVQLNQIDLSETPEVPDLFWIDEPLPALVPTQILDANMFHLFFDYKELHQKAIKTVGDEDEAFISLFYTMYSLDSIEYFYPSWYLKMNDSPQTYSLLGESIHLKMLTKMDSLAIQTDLFQPLLIQLKIEILQDILTNNLYWRNATDIIKEVNQILEADFELISKADKIALKERIKMFEQPKEFEILVDGRNIID
ncbi:MAG: SH3 domain-containing protein [Saprospiraceae bacterium]